MERKRDNQTSLKDAISGFMKTFRLEGKVQEVKIKDKWEEVMGKTISHYTSNIWLRDGVLTIVLNSAPLKQDLMFQKQSIQKRLNDELGEYAIKEIIIR
jgi:predicted nucleic acid-binding Zn ribbon protein